MAHEAVQLVFVAELQLQFRVVAVYESQLVVVDLNRPEFVGLKRLPGEKRCIHRGQYNGRNEPLTLPALRKNR